MILIYLNFFLSFFIYRRKAKQFFTADFRFFIFFYDSWMEEFSGEIMEADSTLLKLIHCAYPNQVVELAEPIVEQFFWVVATLWHFYLLFVSVLRHGNFCKDSKGKIVE